MIYFSLKNKAFFHREIHETMPEDVVEIDEEQHMKLLEAINNNCEILPDLSITPPRPSEHHTWNGKAWAISAKVAAKLAAEQFQAAQNDKIIALNQTAQTFIAQAAGTDKIPEFELQSWNLQAIEAKAWAQNPKSPTPVLNEIAAARGVPADVLKQAALRKTLAYEKLTAHVVGQRQALQTRIEAAKSLDELNAIEITFTLPETGESK